MEETFDVLGAMRTEPVCDHVYSITFRGHDFYHDPLQDADIYTAKSLDMDCFVSFLCKNTEIILTLKNSRGIGELIEHIYSTKPIVEIICINYNGETTTIKSQVKDVKWTFDTKFCELKIETTSLVIPKSINPVSLVTNTSIKELRHEYM